LLWINPRFFSQTGNSKKTTNGDSQHLQLTNQIFNQTGNDKKTTDRNDETNGDNQQPQLTNNARVSQVHQEKSSPTQPLKKVKTTGRYKIGLYGGIGCGILALFLQLSTNIPSVVQYRQKQEIALQIELEKAELQAETALKTESAKQQKKQADSFSENEVNPVHTFSIWGYIDNPKKKPKIDFRAFPKSQQRVYIFDAANRCIGLVHKGKFYWKHAKSSKNVCKGINNNG
jgi:hypothetical protein